MNVIATTTVIRGNGACKVFMDGIMNKEIEKMSERYERQIEALSNELAATKNKENKLLAEKMPVLRACIAKPCAPFSAVRNKLEVAWALVWYLGTEVGLWHDDGKNTKATM